ncbi:hypothetical protein D6774_01260 [Candidatus Woesearchaeota archaeon]|nr:MAG: hypothetical protein D6774_01260 [Candidatus Woesearchaeota archaeon]
MNLPPLFAELYEFAILSKGALTGLQTVCGSPESSSLILIGGFIASKNSEGITQPQQTLEEKIKDSCDFSPENKTTIATNAAFLVDQTMKATILFGTGYAIGAGIGLGLKYLPQLQHYLQ